MSISRFILGMLVALALILGAYVALIVLFTLAGLSAASKSDVPMWAAIPAALWIALAAWLGWKYRKLIIQPSSTRDES
jgi:hypothetical protein